MQPLTGGMGVILGIDCGAPLQLILEAKAIPKNEWQFIIAKLNVISNIAVRYWNKNNDTAKDKPKQQTK